MININKYYLIHGERRNIGPPKHQILNKTTIPIIIRDSLIERVRLSNKVTCLLCSSQRTEADWHVICIIRAYTGCRLEIQHWFPPLRSLCRRMVQSSPRLKVLQRSISHHCTSAYTDECRYSDTQYVGYAEGKKQTEKTTPSAENKIRSVLFFHVHPRNLHPSHCDCNIACTWLYCHLCLISCSLQTSSSV